MPTPLTQHPAFGYLYLEAEAFKDAAIVYGAASAIGSLTGGQLESVLAAASRQIDAALGFDFLGQPRTENHSWNRRQQQSHRFRLNGAHPKTITACKLWLSPSLSENITLTPVRTDGASREFAWGEIIYNRQTRMLEISSWVQTVLQPTFMVVASMNYPFLEITYQGEGGLNQEDIPAAVKLATGYQAARTLTRNDANELLPEGMSSMRTYDYTITRDNRQFGNNTTVNNGAGNPWGNLVPEAQAALAEYVPGILMA